MPSSSPASRSRRLSSMSSGLGSIELLGWLCATMTAAALARMAALNASRGYVAAIIMLSSARSSSAMLGGLLPYAT